MISRAWTRPRRPSWCARARPARAELVDAAIGRVEALNGEINAVIHENFEQAREQAAGELPDGPFKGVPFVLKDLGACFAGMPLHMGMKVLKDADFRAPVDTFLAQRFREAGFVTIGKTNTPAARDPADDRARPLRRLAQPLGHRALDRRLQRRLGGRGRLGDAADRPRQRRRRLDSDPGLELRPRRPQADPPAHLGGTADRRRDVGSDGRARRLALGPRRRGGARGGPRRRAGRSLRRSARPSAPTPRTSPATRASCESASRPPRPSRSRSTRPAPKPFATRPSCASRWATRSSRRAPSTWSRKTASGHRHRRHLHDPLGGRPGGDAGDDVDADRPRDHRR